MPPKRRSTMGSSSSSSAGAAKSDMQAAAATATTTKTTPLTAARRTKRNTNIDIDTDMVVVDVVDFINNHKNSDNDDDNDARSVDDSVATGGSQRSSARLKRKRDLLSSSAAAAAMTSTTNKVLNFDPVMEEEDGNDDDDEQEEDDAKYAGGSTKSTTVPSSSSQQKRRTPKRTKLNTTTTDDDDDDDTDKMTTKEMVHNDTDENIDMVMVDHDDTLHTDDTRKPQPVDATTTTISSFPTATTTTASVTTTSTTSNAVNSNIDTYDNTKFAPSTPTTTTTTHDVIPKPPPFTVTRVTAGTVAPTTIATTTTTAAENTTTTTENTRNDNAVIGHQGDEEEEAMDVNNNNNNNIGDYSERVVTMIQQQVESLLFRRRTRNDNVDETVVYAVDEIAVADSDTAAAESTSTNQTAVTDLFHTVQQQQATNRIQIWCFIIVFVLQILGVIFYPPWMSTMKSVSHSLLQFYTSTGVQRMNVHVRDTIVPSQQLPPKTQNAGSVTLSNTEWTLQELQSKFQQVVQEEKLAYSQLLELQQQTLELLSNTTTMSITNSSISTNSSTMERWLDDYEIILQTRIEQASKMIQQQQLEEDSSKNQSIIQQLIQQYVALHDDNDNNQTNKNSTTDQLQEIQNNRRSRDENNIFLLDLSRSDFFDDDVESTTQPSCNNNIDHPVDSSLPPMNAVQRHEMDIAFQELQIQIRDMINTTILNSDTTMERVLSWIQNETATTLSMLLTQQDKSTLDDDDTTTTHKQRTMTTNGADANDIVRDIIIQRIRKEQSDMVLGKMDYASIVYGGTVLYSTPSLVDTLPMVNRILSKLQLRFYGHTTAEMAITPVMTIRNTIEKTNLGQCWSFPRAKSAMLMIELGQGSIQVQSVSIEHPLSSSSLIGGDDTAIQTFHVYGHEAIHGWELQRRHQFVQRIPSLVSLALNDTTSMNTNNDGWYYLGTFMYDVSKSIFGTNGIMEFPIPKMTDSTNIPPLQIIRLHIDPVPNATTSDISSRKDYSYSCLYRFRVHGEPASSSQ